jgi:hypothetical protein
MEKQRYSPLDNDNDSDELELAALEKEEMSTTAS